MVAHVALFNNIAGAYQWFFKAQVKYYEKAFKSVAFSFPVSIPARLLDAGCGTGALARVLLDRGHDVTGMDVASRMVSLARDNGIDCFQGDLLGLPFRDGEFDLVVSAFVVHGMPRRDREKMLEEVSRVSKNGAMLVDYNVRAVDLPWYVRFVEHVERGDFHGFLKTGLVELETFFRHVTIHEVSRTTAMYLCK